MNEPKTMVTDMNQLSWKRPHRSPPTMPVSHRTQTRAATAITDTPALRAGRGEDSCLAMGDL